MKELLSLASNEFFRKGENDEMQRYHEIVVIVSEPHFQVDEAGAVVRTRKTEAFRFVTSDAGLRQIANDALERCAD